MHGRNEGVRDVMFSLFNEEVFAATFDDGVV